MSNHLALPPEMRAIQSAYRRRDYHAVSPEQLIQAALFFDGIFRREGHGAVRSQVAAILVALYRELNRRMNNAALDSTGLPSLSGVQWSGNPGLAGTLEDIPPFGSLDLWVMALEPSHPVRRHPPRRRGLAQQTVNMPGETVSGQRPSGGAPEMRDNDQLAGIAPLPDVPGNVGDIAGWLDVGNNVLGLAAFVMESLALDLIGTFAGGIISVFGLGATWIDYDRQVARLHAAYQTCATLYDMSFPFSDPNLFRRPYQNWPAIRPPIEADVPSGNSNDAQIQRTARLTARQRAYDLILDMERHPRPRVVRYNGRELRIPITGKWYLYFLNVGARHHNQSVLHYLRDTMQRRTGLNLSMFRW